MAGQADADRAAFFQMLGRVQTEEELQALLAPVRAATQHDPRLRQAVDNLEAAVRERWAAEREAQVSQAELDADRVAADRDRALSDVELAAREVANQRAYRAQLKQIAQQNATSPADYEARLAEARQYYEAGHATVNQGRVAQGSPPCHWCPLAACWQPTAWSGCGRW